MGAAIITTDVISWVAVASMTLPQLLEDASVQKASEIVLQSGRRPQLQTTAGPAEHGPVLTEMDLFDALAQVLAPEQQAELAVGNVVEFDLDGRHGAWSFVTEPGKDGVVLRGRARASAANDDADAFALELPALEPFLPEVEPAAAPRSGTRSTRLDAAIEYGAPDPQVVSPARSQVGTADTIQISVKATSEHVQVMPDEELDFALVDPVGSPSPSAQTIGGELGTLVREIERGTLCLWRDEQTGESLADHLRAPVEIIDDAALGRLASRGLDDLPAHADWLVRIEDPSRCLGFLLRRLEEGARVFVFTRARTGDGALRSLLGVHAQTSAVRWLAAHRKRFLRRSGSGWRLDVV